MSTVSINRINTDCKWEWNDIETSPCIYTWRCAEGDLGWIKLSFDEEGIVYIDDYEFKALISGATVSTRTVLATLQHYIRKIENHFAQNTNKRLFICKIWLGLKISYGTVRDKEFWSKIGTTSPIHGNVWGEIDREKVEVVQRIDVREIR